MSGRHTGPAEPAPPHMHPVSTHRHRRRVGQRVALGTGMAVLTVAAVAWAVVASPAGHETSCPATSPTIRVVADPALAPAVDRAAQEWTRSARSAATCADVQVTSGSGATTVTALSRRSAALPDVWVPDSSQWVQRLRTAIDGEDSPAQSAWVSPAVASSPLVVATGDGRQRVVAAAARGWGSLLSGEVPVTMPHPGQSTAGMLALSALEEELHRSAGRPTRELVARVVRLTSGDDQGTPTSEQQVVAASSDSSGLPAPVYPARASVTYDYPVVRFVPPAQPQSEREAVADLVSSLYDAQAQRIFRDAGFRDAKGDPLPLGSTPPGTSRTAVRPGRQPLDSRMSDAMRAWKAAQRGNRTLVVMDVSGSMASDGKMRFADRALREVVDFLPETSRLGVWRFSSNLVGSRPWQTVVPLGRLDTETDGTRRAEAIRRAADRLRATNGDTGLYATTLAAHRAVRTGYQPQQLNSVVLLTDGSDTVGGLTLPQLLAQLKEGSPAGRRVPVFTIAVGPDADLAPLRAISRASGGTAYRVDDPSDIRNVFLDAVIEGRS